MLNRSAFENRLRQIEELDREGLELDRLGKNLLERANPIHDGLIMELAPSFEGDVRLQAAAFQLLRGHERYISLG